MKLVKLKALEAKQDGSLSVHLSSNETYPLSLADPGDQDYCLEILEGALDYKFPVVLTQREDGSITAVSDADEDTVSALKPAIAGKMAVFLAGHNGVFTVREDDHPVRQKLEEAAQTNRRIWFAADEDLTIRDVMKV